MKQNLPEETAAERAEEKREEEEKDVNRVQTGRVNKAVQGVRNMENHKIRSGFLTSDAADPSNDSCV